MKYTIKDVKASYSPEKRQKSLQQNLLGHIIYRQISFYLTPVFLNLSISAMAVTYSTLAIVAILPFIALFGGPQAYILIAVLCFIYHCLDYIDGNIARVTGTSCDYGMYLDSLFGNLYWISVYASVGILVDKAASEPMLFARSGLFFGLVAAILDILSKESRLYYKFHFVTEKVNFSPVNESKHPVIRALVAAAPSAGYLVVPLLLITGYVEQIFLTLVFCFAVATLMFAYSQYRIIKALKKKGKSYEANPG